MTHDQDPLFLPIKDTDPSGPSLRYTPLYDSLIAARTEDDAVTPRGIWERDLKRADYEFIAQAAYKALSHESKDLQLMGWLIEAWIVLYGLEGLEQGVTSLKRVLEAFWPSVHPKLDDLADPSLRMAPLMWMNEKLHRKIQACIPLAPLSKEATARKTGSRTGGSPDDSGEIIPTLEKIQAAEEQDRRIRQSANPEEARKKLVAKKEVTLETYHKILEKVDPTYFVTLQATLKSVQATLHSIEDFLAAQLPKAAFRFTKWHKAFRAYEVLLTPYIAAMPTPQPPEPDLAASIPIPEPTQEGPKEEAPHAAGIGGGPAGGGAVQLSSLALEATVTSRQQAYDQLERIAGFLMKLEPHSPAPYLIRKAITWGTMDLQELLGQIVQEGGDITHYMQWLGIRKKAGDSA